MKKSALFTVVLSIMMAFSFNASAQDNDSNGANQGRRQFNPEQMAERRAQGIAEELKLDDETAAKFKETYKDYLKEMFETIGKYGKKHGGFSRDAERKTDAQVDEEIKDQFAMERAVIDVREKYYKKFSKFLNPRQVQTVLSKHNGGNNFNRPGHGNHGGDMRGNHGGQGNHGPRHPQPQPRVDEQQ